MPRTSAAKKTDIEENAGITDVRPRTPFDWNAALAKCQREHWRQIRVTIQLREWLLAGKPAQLDAAKAMLKARGLEDAIEAVNVADPDALADAAKQAVDEGLCEFHRRPRHKVEGIWFPTNHIKAGIKENWSVLGLRVEHRGSRGALAEGLFVSSLLQPGQPQVERDWIFLGEEPAGVYTAVAHTVGPKGPLSSIKRHEYVERPRISFMMRVAKAVTEKIPDEAMADTLIHFGEHGLGAARSQGFGKFDVVDVNEIPLE